MKILGIHPFGHDSTVCFLDTSKKQLNAYTLERFSRKKHDMNYVLPYFKDLIIKFTPDVAAFASNEYKFADIKMFKYLQRTYELESAIRKQRLKPWQYPEYLLNKLKVRKQIYFRRREKEGKFALSTKNFLNIDKSINYDHHACHAYSSLWTSSFYKQDRVLVVTIDGQGDAACATLSTSMSGSIERKVTIKNDYSICILYSYFTQVAGFNPNADEGKLEALACYFNKNNSQLLDILRNWIVFDEETLLFRAKKTSEMPFDSIPQNRKGIIKRLSKFLGTYGIEEFSYAIQVFFEETYLSWIKKASIKFKANYICMSGGGAANVKLNLRVFEDLELKGFHVAPPMGDDGVALGAAIMCALKHKEDIEFIPNQSMPFWGSESLDQDIQNAIDKAKSKDLVVQGPFINEELAQKVAGLIENNFICAVFRGNAEFGPRALGHRSILANPTDLNARDSINNKFKRREWFQPFCPIMTESEATRLLVSSYKNKHMTCAFRVKPEFIKSIPSVVHIDGTARAEIISEHDEPFIYSVLELLKSRVGFGVLLNTSFNLHGRAMVNSPMHALDDYIDCGLDYLVLQNYIIRRPKC